MLWPSEARVSVTRRPGRSGAAQWLLLPSASRPRLLVPVGVPAAARMLVRHGDAPGPRAARAVLAAGVRTGLLERLPVVRLRVDAGPDARCLERHLVPYVGEGAVLGGLLGTPRVNRKPVLQVFDRDGHTVAFVKVGHDDRTRWLVRREADNLARVSSLGLAGVQPPEVLHMGAFGDLELLVLAPLVSSQQAGREAAGPPPLEAMDELSRVAGVTSSTLVESRLAQRLSTATTKGATPQEDRLASLVRDVLDRYGAEDVDLGAWHGDWAPWNMGWSAGRLQLWDWERYAEGVPLGFDLVHYASQSVRHDQSGLRASEDSLVALLAQLLPAVGVSAEHAVRTLLLYLLELASRFVVPENGVGVATIHALSGRWT